MSVSISEVTNNQSFGVLLERVNQIAETISGNVLTTGSLTGGAVTTGNAFVNGILGSNIVYATYLSGGNISSNSVLTITSNTFVNNYLTVGNSTINAAFGYVSATQAIGTFNASVNSYLQTTTTNDNTGPSSSADWVAYNDLHDEAVFIDMGINGSNWSNTQWTINGENDSYLYAGGGNLSIGANDAGAYVSFFTGGTYAENERVRITSGGNVGIGMTNPDAKLSVVGTANVTGNVTIGGYTIISNTVTILGVNSNIIPVLNDTYSLGNNTNRYSDLWVSGDSIHLGTVTLTDNSGSLQAPGIISTGNASVLGSLSVADNVTVTNSVSVSNTVSVTGNVSIGGALTLTGSFTVGNNLFVSNNVSVNNNITVTGNTTLSKNISVTGNATFSNAVAVTGNVTLSNSVTITGNLSLSNTLAVTGNVSLSNTLTVNGALTVNSSISALSNATFSNTLAVTGNATFSNTVAVTGDTTLGGTLVVTGATTVNNNLNVNGSITVANSNVFLSTNSTVSFTVGNTGTNTVVNATSISVNRVLATNVSGTIVTTSQPYITANNATYFGGQLPSYYTGSSATAYANAVAYADAILVTALTPAYAYADAQTATAYANAVIFANTVANNAYTNAVTYSSNGSNITTGTIPSGRLSGSYTGITAIGTISGNLAISNNTTTNTLIVTKTVSIGTDLTVTNNTLSNTLTVTYNANVGANLAVTNGLLVGGAANIVGSLGVGGNANVGGDVRVVGNLYVTGTTTTVGTSTATGDLIPSSNLFSLGNTTNRFSVFGMTGNFATSLTANVASFGNTIPTSTGATTLGNTSYRWVMYANSIDVSSNGSFANIVVTSTSTLNVASITSPTITGLLTAQGNAVFQSNVTANGIVSIGNTVTVTGNAVFQSNVTANGVVAVGNNVVVTGNTTVTNYMIVNSTSYAYSTKYNVSGLLIQTADSFSATAYRSAEYIVQITDATSTSYQVSKLLMLHDGTNAYVTEYAQLNNNGLIGTFSADINAGNVRLRVIPTIATSVVTLTRTSLVV